MDPVTTGALIGAGGNLAGALIGSSDAHKNRQLQKEFAQYGIRWRVEDAKAAGLHPLYALGAQIPSYSPVYSEAGAQVAEMGQNIGRAVQATATRNEKVMHALAVQKMLAEIGETDARRELALSQAARLRQSGNESIGPFPGEYGVAEGQTTPNITAEGAMDFDWEGGVYGPRRFRGLVQPEIPKVPVASGEDQTLMSGRPPMWREYQIAPNKFITLPSANDPSEALEAMSESLPLMWAVYRENVARYGEGWGDWFWDRYIEGASGDVADWWKNARRKWRNGGR